MERERMNDAMMFGTFIEQTSFPVPFITLLLSTIFPFPLFVHSHIEKKIVLHFSNSPSILVKTLIGGGGGEEERRGVHETVRRRRTKGKVGDRGENDQTKRKKEDGNKCTLSQQTVLTDSREGRGVNEARRTIKGWRRVELLINSFFQLLCFNIASEQEGLYPIKSARGRRREK